MDFNTFVYTVFVAMVIGVGALLYRLFSDVAEIKVQVAEIATTIKNLMESL